MCKLLYNKHKLSEKRACFGLFWIARESWFSYDQISRQGKTWEGNLEQHLFI